MGNNLCFSSFRMKWEKISIVSDFYETVVSRLKSETTAKIYLKNVRILYFFEISFLKMNISSKTSFVILLIIRLSFCLICNESPKREQINYCSTINRKRNKHVRRRFCFVCTHTYL